MTRLGCSCVQDSNDDGIPKARPSLPWQEGGGAGRLRIIHLRSEGRTPDFPLQLLHLCFKLKNLLFGHFLIALHIYIFRG